MKVHHTTILKDVGNCTICKKPILMQWWDESETSGQSEAYKEHSGGVLHYYGCGGGRSLSDINEDRKKIYTK